jgi:hypothetical protein
MPHLPISFLGSWENSRRKITECLFTPIVKLLDAISSAPVWENDSDIYHASVKSSSGNQYTDTKDSTSLQITSFENENGCDRQKIKVKYKSTLNLHYPGPT